MAFKTRELQVAMSAAYGRAPGFAIPLALLCEISESSGVPTAGVSSQFKAYFNTQFMTKELTTVDERLFVICHEALHVMCYHPQRAAAWLKRGFGPDGKRFKPDKYNYAGDLWINFRLVDEKIGSLPKCGGIYDANLNPKLTVDEIYCNLPDESKNWPGKPTKPAGGDNGGFDTHVEIDPSQMPTDNQVKDAISHGVYAAKQAGKGTGNLMKEFDKALQPSISWEDKLRLYITQAVGAEEYSYTKPDKKKLYFPPNFIAPGPIGSSPVAVYLSVDVSGSISRDEMSKFMFRVGEILTTCRPRACRLQFWDDGPQGSHILEQYDELTDKHVPTGGSGGTNMEDSFHVHSFLDWASEFDAGVILCFTDGYTHTKNAPHWPVIWITTDKEDFAYGEIVKI